MSKLALFAGGGAAALGAAAYYVSPALQADTEVPPILIEGSPAEVRQRIDRETYKALTKAGAQSRELQALGKLTPRWDDATNGHSNVVFLGDHVLRIDYALVAVGADKTELDVKVSFPDSAFSRSAELHPYDLKAAAATVDLLATEYLGSIFEGRRMASGKELMPLFTERTGFSETDTKAFAKRIEAAANEAYGERIKSYASSMAPDGWGDYPGAGAEAGEWEAARDAREAQREIDAASAPMDNGEYSDQ